MLYIDLKIPLTCCVNCMDDITGNKPIAESKHDSGCSKWKCRINYVGGMREGGVSMGNW